MQDEPTEHTAESDSKPGNEEGEKIEEQDFNHNNNNNNSMFSNLIKSTIYIYI